MASCFILNRSRTMGNEDFALRKSRIKAVCEAAGVCYNEYYLDREATELRNAIAFQHETRPADAPFIAFIHTGDDGVGSARGFNGGTAWSEFWFAIFYSGQGVSETLVGDNPRIKCLNARFPLEVDEDTGRFKLLVEAVKAAATGGVEPFVGVDINRPIVPAIIRMCEELDLVLQVRLVTGQFPAQGSALVAKAMGDQTAGYATLWARRNKDLSLPERTGLEHAAEFLRIAELVARGGCFPQNITETELSKAHEQFVEVKEFYESR